MLNRAQILGILALAATVCAARAYQSGKAPGVLASDVHALNGVKVELMELRRDSPTVVIARWRYKNETGETRRLSSESTGPIDPYRLALNSYLIDEQTQARYPVARDGRNDPVASRNGRPNEFITIYPKATIQVWARYPVPESVNSVTVAIEGVPPFPGIAIAKP